MSGETHLGTLLAALQPILDPEVYVFATTREPYDTEALKPQAQIVETKGTTLIVAKSNADAYGLVSEFPSRRITLNVHSSLAAVGFMAAIAACLAEAGISTNPVAGFYHDHLFVPEDRADDAMAALSQLREKAVADTG
jgi:hypothetical protein